MDTSNHIVTDLLETLSGIFQVDVDQLVVEDDPTAPYRYTVWFEGDIVGAGDSASEAVEDAIAQSRMLPGRGLERMA